MDEEGYNSKDGWGREVKVAEGVGKEWIHVFHMSIGSYREFDHGGCGHVAVDMWITHSLMVVIDAKVRGFIHTIAGIL